MIKNLNDIISIITLICLAFISLKFLITIFIKDFEISNVKINRFELLREYKDNEEE